MAAVARPRIESVRPGELVAWARAGRLRIPPFQRPFRWDRRDVTQLFDSIMRGYPIGNLLVWQRAADAASISIGPLTIEAQAQSDALWVVDGQQRITSLVGALTADPGTVDPRFRIYCDLRSGEFVSQSRHREPGPHLMHVGLALDTAGANAWIREHPELTQAEIAIADQMVAAIRDYTIPMYIVVGDDERALRTIFDRMNTSGKAMKNAEVFNALHSISTGRQPNDLRALADRVNAFGFGEFTEQVLLQSMLAIRDPRVDRDFRAEFDSDDAREKAMRVTESALGHVVDFLRDIADIPHLRLLPYALYVPVLARFAALFGAPDGRPAELLRRWIWRGAVLGVAPQGNTVGLRLSARAVSRDPMSSAERLLKLLPPAQHEGWQPDLGEVRLNTAQGKLNVLGLFSRRPRWLVGEQAGQALTAHELFDSADFLQPVITSRSTSAPRSMANRVLHPKGLDGGLQQALRTGKVTPSLLESHVIDKAAVIQLLEADLQGFLARRTQALRQVIGDHVQAHALFGFRDGPQLSSLFDEDANESA
ncbi:DUF262 domain-containing protein [Kribbella sp. NPDC048915]|uniref:DUF262 domain-containing protein n=1 Tax=Kribbella sp. NPDC048915 TaxID=3155148 RepID=UPI0033ECBDEF